MSRSVVKRRGVAGRLGPLAASALLALSGIAAGTVAGAGPQPFAPVLSAPDVTATDQLIVGWQDAGSISSAADAGTRAARADRVSAASGERATWVRGLAAGGDVYRLGSQLTPERVAATVAALRAQPDVAYVEPDQILRPVASPPNDPYWTTPAPGQWDLSEGTTATSYGIDVLGAWDATLGSGVVVAVLDTGITVHPDLAGQTVPGYDFITDPTTANDGDGRDADPSDPGDWCGASPSSWHGTHVSGTIAALTNNATGVAGIAPAAKIEPVRVLGVCGGRTSDISDAIIWASGGAVTGVPANATPARVINMSLGGSGPCGTTMQTAINGAVARGTVVAVAAGNSGADASGFSPANCAGVIAVAATDRTGARASFSNYGSLVEMAAPGVSLWSTLNDGATVPGNPTYAQYSGTSMATPHVAGVAALMLAANPALTPAQVTTLMQQTAHPFKAGGCPQGCGAGIVDAARAVAAAQPFAVTSVTPSSGPPAGGTAVTIGGSGFTGATAVSFGATRATSFSVSSDTQISAVSPAGTGTVDVTVTGPLGTTATWAADQFTFAIAPPANPIVNGGFESGDFTGWTRTGTTAVLTTNPHGGTYDGRGGSTVATNGDSTVAQTFTVPASGGTLSFWYRIACPDTVTYDWVTATLRDTVTATTATLLPRTCTNTNTWVQVSASLASQAGHAVTLTLVSHDDNYAADPTFTLWDDVVVQ